MKPVIFRFIFASVPFFGVFGAATVYGQAWHGCAPNDSGCQSRECRCCRWCDAICRYRVADDRTHCAWRRTWYGPDALATPLRQYYIPRPPECSECNGYAAGYVLGNFPPDPSSMVVSPNLSPEAADGFSPAQFERLGKVRNELDVFGSIGGPASTRAAAPARN